MRRVSILTLLASMMAAVSSCAPVSRMPDMAPDAVRSETDSLRQLVIEQHLDDAERLHRIVYPILAANASLCGTRITRVPGFLVENRFDFPSDYRSASVSAGLGDGLSVVAVAPDSPAARAGVARGDRVIAVAGTPLSTGTRARRDLAEQINAGDGAAIALEFERDGRQRSVTLQTQTICDMPAIVEVNEAINASANGRGLIVTTGLLRFLGSDAELAVVVGHEIAHNVQGHIGLGVNNQGAAALFDFFNTRWGVKPDDRDSEKLPIGQAYEAEADYVGLYLIARAGFPTSAAATVYRRFAVSAPTSIAARRDSTHPSSPARVVMLGETAREIEAKRAQDLPLLPELNKTTKSH